MKANSMKVLILCTGNSCRSQMAHGFLQALNKHMMVRSAGTEPAAKINRRAVGVMAEAGIDISNHTPELVDLSVIFGKSYASSPLWI